MLFVPMCVRVYGLARIDSRTHFCYRTAHKTFTVSLVQQPKQRHRGSLTLMHTHTEQYTASVCEQETLASLTRSLAVCTCVCVRRYTFRSNARRDARRATEPAYQTQQFGVTRALPLLLQCSSHTHTCAATTKHTIERTQHRTHLFASTASNLRRPRECVRVSQTLHSRATERCGE